MAATPTICTRAQGKSSRGDQAGGAPRKDLAHGGAWPAPHVKASTGQDQDPRVAVLGVMFCSCHTPPCYRYNTSTTI